MFCGPRRKVMHRIAVFVRCMNVEKAKFVSPCCIVGDCRLDRVSGVDKINEVHALHDSAVGHVQARYDPGLQHAGSIGIPVQRGKMILQSA